MSIYFSWVDMMYLHVPKPHTFLTLHLIYLLGFPFTKFTLLDKHVIDSPFTMYIPLYSYSEALSLSMSISFSWVDMICLHVPKLPTVLTPNL